MRREGRAAVLLVACVVAACTTAGDDDPVVAGGSTIAPPSTFAPGAPPAADDGSPAVGPGPGAAPTPPVAPAGGASTTVPARGGGPAATTTSTRATGGGQVRPVPAVDDDGRLGTMGEALLSPAIPEAVIEVDSTEGLELTAEARQGVSAALRTYGGKRTVGSAGASTVPASRVYTLDGLRRLAAGHRATHSDDRRVAVYVLVLEGRFETEGVTGVAFEASSFAIFPDTLGGGLLSSASYPRFERSVAVHELGHLFGLVDLTGQGAFHEDPEHPGHAVSQGSVMYWAVEDVTIANLFRGGPPSDFDADDRREMDLIRSGS